MTKRKHDLMTKQFVKVIRRANPNLNRLGLEAAFWVNWGITLSQETLEKAYLYYKK